MGLKALVRDFLPPIVLRAVRPSSPKKPASSCGGYIPASETIAAAQQAGLSIGDYVEKLWGNPAGSAKVVQNLFDVRAISTIKTKTIVDIDHILKRHQPERYQIYETAQDWNEWLASTYQIEACVADGQSLKQTDNASIDLVHAHGVFVYLPFLVSCNYFREIFRVMKREGFVAFDAYSEQCMTRDIVDKWFASVHRYPYLRS